MTMTAAQERYRLMVAHSRRAAAERLTYFARRVEDLEARGVGNGDRRLLDEARAEVEGITAALDAAVACRRCGRALRKPRARRRHYGDDCWQILLAAGHVDDDGDRRG